jgi:cytochrome c peroxidase
MLKYFFACALAGLLYSLSSFQTKPNPSPTLESVRKYYHQGLDRMDKSLHALVVSLENPTSTPKEWQVSYCALRSDYKKIEFLLAFLDEDNVRDFINGPPLPTIDRVVAELVVYEAAGMQIMEEHLYAENAAESRAELLQLTRDMSERFAPIRTTQKNLYFSDRQVMEALRAGIFRLTTMGLTGFDSPGAGASLQESAASMEAMHAITRLYLPYLKDNNNLADSIDSLFEGGIQNLQTAASFETFDRLACIRAFLEPLYGNILKLHLALGLETVNQVSRLSTPLHYLSPSMFSAHTFNDHYYAGIGAAVETPAAISLGRTLFFDPLLSSNNQRACASCHLPERAFTDGQAQSLAADAKGTVGRNAPTIINCVLADKYFYDFRSDRLETQADHVIFNAKEFNTSYYEILDKISQSAQYRAMFREAFSHEPNASGIARALAAYVRATKSFNSPVDQYLRGEISIIDEDVRKGFNLFMGKALCGTCHFAPTYSGLVPPSFTENESEVIGVPHDPFVRPLRLDPDLGRYENGRARDHAPHLKHSFKTPTVRNVALTAPYMHQGAYPTLASVVDFYNRGGGKGLGLTVPYQTLPFDQLNLNTQEQQALIRFMESLTDTTGLTQKPRTLPAFEHNTPWNNRTIGGEY